MAGERGSGSEGMKHVSRAERRSTHTEQHRTPEAAQKIVQRETQRVAQEAEDLQEIEEIQADLGISAPERRSTSGRVHESVRHETSASMSGMDNKAGATPFGSREAISKFGESARKGGQDVVDPYAKSEKKSWWSRAKESLMGPSAETVKQMREEAEALPDVHAPEYVRQDKQGVRETTRHETSAGMQGVENKAGATPFGSREAISKLGEKMRATQALEGAEQAGPKTEAEWWNQSGVEQLAGAWKALNKEMGDAHAAETSLLSFGVPKKILEKYKTPEDLQQFVEKPGFWSNINGDAAATRDGLNKLVEEMTVARKDSAAMKSLAQKSRGAGFPSIGKLPGGERGPSKTEETEEPAEIKKAA